MDHRLRLQRLSRTMSVLTALIGALALVIFAAYWFGPDLPARLARDYLVGATASVGLPGMTTALIVSSLMLLAVIWGIVHAFWLFRDWQTGAQPPTAGRHVRHMGLALITIPIVKIAGGVAVSIMMTLDRAPGTRELNVAVGLEDLVIALTGVVLVAIGLALTDAAAIAEEHRQFV